MICDSSKYHSVGFPVMWKVQELWKSEKSQRILLMVKE